jgi:hypothetical protein
MEDRTRAQDDRGPGHELPVEGEIPLARDVTTCVLGFVRDRVTPVAEWVAWTGGDPHLVVLVIGEERPLLPPFWAVASLGRDTDLTRETEQQRQTTTTNEQ